MKRMLISLSMFSVFTLGVTESNAQGVAGGSIGSYNGAVAVGIDSRVEAHGGIALGIASVVKVTGGIALGSELVATRAGGELGEFFTNEAPFKPDQPNWELMDAGWKSGNDQGALTIGYRQIVGVAAGSKPTDAANVAQLYNLRDYADYELNEAKENFNSQFTVMGERVGVLETSMEALKDGFTIRAKNGYQEIRVRQGDVTMGGNRIQGVGDAVAATDAVNKRQLDNTARSLHKKINDVDKDMKAGVAMALAVAGLPQAYIPGKSMLAMSAGTYQGQSGFALGLSHATENRAWIVKGSATVDTRGNFGGNVGAGYQF